MPPPSATTSSSLLAGALLAALAGCSSHGGVTTAAAPPANVNPADTTYAPLVPMAGVPLTVSAQVDNLGPAIPTATWTASRDGTVAVASGNLSATVPPGPVPLSFNDTVAVPGVHRYVITLTPAGSAASQTTLDVPVAYDLVPGLQGTAAGSVLSLTVSVTNGGGGDAAFVVPFTITDTQGAIAATPGSFDFTVTPLAPGATATQVVNVAIPASGNDTYTLTIDPSGSLGTNLAGSPALVALPIGSG